LHLDVMPFGVSLLLEWSSNLHERLGISPEER
jgi:hypothetical protein